MVGFQEEEALKLSLAEPGGRGAVHPWPSRCSISSTCLPGSTLGDSEGGVSRGRLLHPCVGGGRGGLGGTGWKGFGGENARVTLISPVRAKN